MGEFIHGGIVHKTRLGIPRASMCCSASPLAGLRSRFSAFAPFKMKNATDVRTGGSMMMVRPCSIVWAYSCERRGTALLRCFNEERVVVPIHVCNCVVTMLVDTQTRECSA